MACEPHNVDRAGDRVAHGGMLPAGGADEGMIREHHLAIVHRVCAWCGKEFGRHHWVRPSDDEIITWGICSHCLELREGEDDADEAER